jgi:hypothetical protein
MKTALVAAQSPAKKMTTKSLAKRTMEHHGLVQPTISRLAEPPVEDANVVGESPFIEPKSRPED